MSINRNKERVMITLPKEQNEQFAKAAAEMGISKSTLMQIATMQYIRSMSQSKDIAKEILARYIDEHANEIDINKVKEII